MSKSKVKRHRKVEMTCACGRPFIRCKKDHRPAFQCEVGQIGYGGTNPHHHLPDRRKE